jgi:protein gp37
VACALRDEACEHCYALKGWYRLDLSHQVDRVLRLELLQRLISEHRLPTWIDWAGDELNALPPDEPLPPSLRGQCLPDAWCRGERIRYMRWHDSGDLFHEEYALAIIKVCEATPQAAHWLPTRMGRLISSLVQRGVTIPPNLSILVSVQRGGALEQAQIQAVRQVLKAQPHARIGLVCSKLCRQG